tara:strand:+ start:135 stop:620 length:486 start_codon:yes stop_codon:yes gene_type:complete
MGFLNRIEIAEDHRKTYKHLREEYTREIARHQVKVFQLRQKRGLSKFSRWTCSSSLKSAFSNLMIVGHYDNKGYTITEISDLLNCSRQATTNMVNDCLAEGWIDEISKLRYVAGIAMKESYSTYLDEYIQATLDTDVVAIGQAYRGFSNVKSIYINKSETN